MISRRSFLISAGVAALGAAVLPRFLATDGIRVSGYLTDEDVAAEVS